MVKGSLAVDQNMGPHNSGCGTCQGLITIHNGDARSGQVDFTVEYYDTGQLTKFVKPGAFRIDSTANSTIPNVAWLNPDGSKALVAYNGTGGTHTGSITGFGGKCVDVAGANPANGTQVQLWTCNGSSAQTWTVGTGAVQALGKCLDVAAAGTANGTKVQLF